MQLRAQVIVQPVPQIVTPHCEQPRHVCVQCPVQTPHVTWVQAPQVAVQAFVQPQVLVQPQPVSVQPQPVAVQPSEQASQVMSQLSTQVSPHVSPQSVSMAKGSMLTSSQLTSSQEISSQQANGSGRFGVGIPGRSATIKSRILKVLISPSPCRPLESRSRHCVD
jgi:hypothetical protein